MAKSKERIVFQSKGSRNEGILVLCVLAILAVIISGVLIHRAHVRAMERQEILQISEWWNKVTFAEMMQFNMLLDGNVETAGNTHVFDENGNRRFIDFVLVHSAEEAAWFEDDIFVAWPSETTEQILLDLNEQLDEHILSGDTILPETVSYPITMRDLVDHWKDVLDLGMRPNPHRELH